MAYDLYGWFDGACYPFNPGGTGGWGAILKDGNGATVYRRGGIIGSGPLMSNNVAEHCAARKLLERIEVLTCEGWSVKVYGDSMMVINQLARRWRAKRGLYVNEYKRSLIVLDRLNEQGVIVDFAWIPREENFEADALSNATNNLPPTIQR